MGLRAADGADGVITGMKRAKLNPRKVLVASAGVATISYLSATACSDGPPTNTTVANLMPAPYPTPAAVANLVAPVPATNVTVANLLPPPMTEPPTQPVTPTGMPDGDTGGTSGDAGLDAGQVPDAGDTDAG